MAKKYYVVWRGRQTGIFTAWDACRRQVDGYAGAEYKGFNTQQEAEAAFAAGKERSAAVSSVGAKSRRTRQVTGTSVQTLRTFTADEIAALTFDTLIFADGACDPNPGEAGSGIAVYRGGVISELWFGCYNPEGTNNTAELTALNHALLIGQGEIGAARSAAIFCDSTYSIQAVTQWAFGWEKRGWKRRDGEIANLSLIQEMFALYRLLDDRVPVFHVNGHVGIEGNELADRMSMLAIEAQEADLCRYRDAINVTDVLAMRAG